MGAETLIIARTDSEAATLLDNNCDSRDHPFILGSSNPNIIGFNDALKAAKNKGEVEKISIEWDMEANLCTYGECVEKALIGNKASANTIQKWKSQWENLSHDEAMKLAIELGVNPHWSMEHPRTKEGYYRIRGGVEFGIRRGIAFAPYADLIWMETKDPAIKEARYFARGVRAVHPWIRFAYNLSPSFNWDAAKMSELEIKQFQDELGKEGYVWQFITLAGFHTDSLAIDDFSKAFAEDKMLAYVQMVQRKEREHAVETLTHQKWSGAELMDALSQTITGGTSSTTALQNGNTEAQFH
jgi:isocitrate lyase